MTITPKIGQIYRVTHVSGVTSYYFHCNTVQAAHIGIRTATVERLLNLKTLYEAFESLRTGKAHREYLSLLGTLINEYKWQPTTSWTMEEYSEFEWVA